MPVVSGRRLARWLDLHTLQRLATDLISTTQNNSIYVDSLVYWRAPAELAIGFNITRRNHGMYMGEQTDLKILLPLMQCDYQHRGTDHEEAGFLMSTVLLYGVDIDWAQLQTTEDTLTLLRSAIVKAIQQEKFTLAPQLALYRDLLLELGLSAPNRDGWRRLSLVRKAVPQGAIMSSPAVDPSRKSATKKRRRATNDEDILDQSSECIASKKHEPFKVVSTNYSKVTAQETKHVQDSLVPQNDLSAQIDKKSEIPGMTGDGFDLQSSRSSKQGKKSCSNRKNKKSKQQHSSSSDLHIVSDDRSLQTVSEPSQAGPIPGSSPPPFKPSTFDAARVQESKSQEPLFDSVMAGHELPSSPLARFIKSRSDRDVQKGRDGLGISPVADAFVRQFTGCEKVMIRLCSGGDLTPITDTPVMKSKHDQDVAALPVPTHVEVRPTSDRTSAFKHGVNAEDVCNDPSDISKEAVVSHQADHKPRKIVRGPVGKKHSLTTGTPYVTTDPCNDSTLSSCEMPPLEEGRADIAGGRFDGLAGKLFEGHKPATTHEINEATKWGKGLTRKTEAGHTPKAKPLSSGRTATYIDLTLSDDEVEEENTRTLTHAHAEARIDWDHYSNLYRPFQSLPPTRRSRAETDSILGVNFDEFMPPGWRR